MSLGPSKRKKGPRKPVRGLGYLPDVVKVPKRMKSKRADPRPGNKPMTDREWELIEEAKTGTCIPCWLLVQAGVLESDEAYLYAGWDHAKLGNLRIGHVYGWASCNWHHQGLVIDREGWTHAQWREKYGPSLAEGTGPFHEMFGSQEALMVLQLSRLLPFRVPVDPDGGMAEVDRLITLLGVDVARKGGKV